MEDQQILKVIIWTYKFKDDSQLSKNTQILRKSLYVCVCVCMCVICAGPTFKQKTFQGLDEMGKEVRAKQDENKITHQ